MLDVAKVLADNGISGKNRSCRTTEGNQKLKCPQCQPPHKESDNPLSVTISHDGVVWLCHHCDWSGGAKDNVESYFKPQPKKSYNKPVMAKQDPTSKMLDWFKTRSISKETVENMKIKSDKNMIAFHYIDADGSVANIKYRGAKKTFTQTPGTKQIIYNYDNVYRKEEIIFVEGEMDVLALWEVGLTNATTLPGGAGKEFKGDKNDKRFAPLVNSPLNAKKVILFTDNDGPGKVLHKELVHRFGKDICWFVRPPEGCKDANEVLSKHGKEALQRLIKDAEPYPVEGLYKARDFFNEVHDLYDGNFEKPLEIGIPPIDEIYKVMPGTFTVVTGVPNHGKSLLLDQILLNMARIHDWKFVLFSPEHSTAMHIRRLVQMHLNLSFDEGFANRMTKEQLNQGIEFIDKHFYFIETKDAVPEIDLLLQISKSAIFKFGCKGVVLDPFNEISAKRSAGQREDEWIRDFVSKCKRFTRVHNVVFYTVAHPTKMPRESNGKFQVPDAYSISGSAHWSNLSDVILTVYRDFDEGVTKLITRKIREQDLYGKIGEADLMYDMTKRCFKPMEYSNDNYLDIYD